MNPDIIIPWDIWLETDPVSDVPQYFSCMSKLQLGQFFPPITEPDEDKKKRNQDMAGGYETHIGY